MTFSLRKLTIERTTFFILFILLFALSTRVAADTDMWWHLRIGQSFLETGQFSYTDIYSFTFAGEPRINYGVGAQIIMYAIWSVAGNFGMSLFTAILATWGMYLVYKAGQGSVYMQAFVLIFGAATAAVFWSPRPQMFTFFFTTVFIYILFDYKRNGRGRLLWLIPVMWLWGNSHPGFAIGYIFLVAFIVGEFLNNLVNTGDSRIPMQGVRKLVLVAIASTAILLLNPNGLDLLKVPFTTLGMDVLRRYIQEWQTPNFNQRFTWGFVILLATVIGAVWASKRKFDWTDWLLVCGTTFMSLTAGRNLAVFAVAVVPIATYHFDEIMKRNGWMIAHREYEQPFRAKINLLLIILVSIGALANILLVADPETVDKAQTEVLPIDAVNYLNESAITGNMFNSYNWGGYLMFTAPQHKVFIDGRTDLYTEFLDDYFSTAIGSKTWRDEFEKWDIDFALIESRSGLADELREAPDWESAYEDDVASLFVREEGS